MRRRWYYVAKDKRKNDMVRLPTPGADDGEWGQILNEFLGVEHNADGTLKVSGSLATKVDKDTIVHNVKDYGAIGDGSANDTAAIQAAINAGGITFFPAGVYMHSGLTLIRGSHLMGVNAGGYVKDYAPANQQPIPAAVRSCLRLIAGSNAHSITIPADTPHGVIEYLEIDGNKAGQTTNSGIGIYLPNAANAEEAQWKFNRIYVHDVRSNGLSIGSNRQGCSIHQSVFFACGANDATSGSGIVISGSDTTVDGCFVGVCWGDSIKILSGVNRILNTEVFSNVLSASSAGAGIAIADSFNCTRNVISGCTLDRCAGTGLYIGTTCSYNVITNNIFHSNSQKTNGASYHFISKANGNLLAGNQFAPNDPDANSNKPNYAVFILTGTTLMGKNLNSVAATAYNTAAVNDTNLLVIPNL